MLSYPLRVASTSYNSAVLVVYCSADNAGLMELELHANAVVTVTPVQTNVLGQGRLLGFRPLLMRIAFSFCRSIRASLYCANCGTANIQRRHFTDFKHATFHSPPEADLEGDEPAPPPPPLGDGLTPSLTVNVS